jgi:hypothetical protein
VFRQRAADLTDLREPGHGLVIRRIYLRLLSRVDTSDPAG